MKKNAKVDKNGKYMNVNRKCDGDSITSMQNLNAKQSVILFVWY